MTTNTRTLATALDSRLPSDSIRESARHIRQISRGLLEGTPPEVFARRLVMTAEKLEEILDDLKAAGL